MKRLRKIEYLIIGLTLSFFSTSCRALINSRPFQTVGLAEKRHSIDQASVDSIRVTFAEASRLLPEAKAGTVFLIKNGRYTDIDIILRKSNNKPIKIKAENDGKVIITGKSSIRISDTENLVFSGFLFDKILSKDVLILSNSRNIRISNNFFEKCGSEPNGKIIRIENGSSNNDISYNTLNENRSAGVVIVTDYERDAGNIDNTIHHNFFYNIPSVKELYPKGDNGLEAIQLGQGIKGSKLKLNTHIHNNLFELIVGDGSEIISVKSSNNKIYNNTFLNNRSGITIRLGDNCYVNDNYLRNTTQGIRIFGYGHIIENNYIEECAVGIQLPATHFSRRDIMSSSGYYQQENIKIVGNTIINPRVAAFLIGNHSNASDRRTLMPKKTRISENNILINRTEAQDYELENGDKATIKNIRIRGNNTTRMSNSKSLAGLVTREFSRYQSKDRSIGAKWRRP